MQDRFESGPKLAHRRQAEGSIGVHEGEPLQLVDSISADPVIPQRTGTLPQRQQALDTPDDECRVALPKRTVDSDLMMTWERRRMVARRYSPYALDVMQDLDANSVAPAPHAANRTSRKLVRPAAAIATIKLASVLRRMLCYGPIRRGRPSSGASTKEGSTRLAAPRDSRMVAAARSAKRVTPGT